MALRLVHVNRSAPGRKPAGRHRRPRPALGRGAGARSAGSGLAALLLLVGVAMGSSAANAGPMSDTFAAPDTVAFAAWHPSSPTVWAPVDTPSGDEVEPAPHGAAPSPSLVSQPPEGMPVDPDPAASEALPDLDAVVLGLSSTTQVLESGFVRPVHGLPTSAFGPRYHPILHIWKLHSGQDFGAPCGAPVWAAKAGTVLKSGPAGGNGTQVAIDHGNGLVTTYNHLSAYAAKPGMPVAQGQVIGLVGTTGLSTGCHLHFEVILNGAFVDPAPYLAMAPAPVVTLPPTVAQVTPTPSPTASTTASVGVSTDPTTTMPPTTAPTESTPSATQSPSMPGSTTTSPTSSPVGSSSPPTTGPTAPTTSTATTTSSATTSATGSTGAGSSTGQPAGTTTAGPPPTSASTLTSAGQHATP